MELRRKKTVQGIFYVFADSRCSGHSFPSNIRGRYAYHIYPDNAIQKESKWQESAAELREHSGRMFLLWLVPKDKLFSSVRNDKYGSQ